MILGIETSGPSSFLALFGRDLQLEVGCLSPFSHAESLNNLLSLVEEIAPLRELDGIALSLGPGFFTSLRAGAAMAKALSVTIGLPIVGISTLRALARESGPGVIACALDAKKGQVYGAIYRVKRDIHELVAPGIFEPDELVGFALEHRATGFAGDGAIRYGMKPLIPIERPSALTIAEMGVDELSKGNILPALDFIPDYMREPDAVAKTKNK
ncbi:MAG: tRNA (adenosine(37)-N6)-threonylcarbamoyltransferase complex dimerization subunit type 1 TsaB [candidate division WOR-3 bacterium]